VTGEIGPTGVSLIGPIIQTGDNRSTIGALAEAGSGDAISGAVMGIVGGAGSVDVATSNRTVDSDADTGNATFENSDRQLVGPVVLFGPFGPFGAL
jgi:hypothetical protein